MTYFQVVTQEDSDLLDIIDYWLLMTNCLNAP